MASASAPARRRSWRSTFVLTSTARWRSALRKLTGSRGKSCKIAVLHQKVIDAWADRLSLLNESDVTALREQHPGRRARPSLPARARGQR